MEEEVLAALIDEGHEADFEKWKSGKKIEPVRITVLFEIWLNERSTDTQYDFKLIHALLIGTQFKKVIGYQVFQRDATFTKQLKDRIKNQGSMISQKTILVTQRGWK